MTLKELGSSTAEIGVSVHRTTLSCTLHRARLYGRVTRKEKKTLLRSSMLGRDWETGEKLRKDGWRYIQRNSRGKPV